MAVWELYEGQESPCSSQTFGCHDVVMVSYQLKHGLQYGLVYSNMEVLT